MTLGVSPHTWFNTWLLAHRDNATCFLLSPSIYTTFFGLSVGCEVWGADWLGLLNWCANWEAETMIEGFIDWLGSNS